MTAKIPIEVAKKIQELSPQVMSLDLVSIMELEVLDYADWVVNEYTDMCREDAEEEALTNEQFSTLFKDCIYESVGEVEKKLRKHVYHVVESARVLFSKFYDYAIPDTILVEYYDRAQKIIHEYLTKFMNNAKNAYIYATSSH
jgi:hypothetical protein